MAKHLSNFVPLIGGPEYSTDLFLPLETLFNAEENVVREASVHAIAHIVEESPQDLSPVIIDIVKRLMAAEWFTTRMSAPGLISETYKRMNPATKEEMKALVHTLAKDETPVVRRAVLQSFDLLGSVVDAQFLREDMMQLLRALTNDDHAYVRVCAVEQYPGFCDNLRKAGARGANVLREDRLYF
jgi:vesicle coat complex subunit